MLAPNTNNPTNTITIRAARLAGRVGPGGLDLGVWLEPESE
jgi:hypothetical protein